MKQYLMVLISIFLIITETEHLFIYLLAICKSSSVKCLFIFSPFLNRVISFFVLWGFFFGFVCLFWFCFVLFGLLSCRTSLYILETNHLSDIWSEHTFSYSVRSRSALLAVSFCCVEAF